MTLLADIIIPKDERSGQRHRRGRARVHRLHDDRSAEHADADARRPALARHAPAASGSTRTFVDLAASDRTAILDAIAYPKKAAPESARARRSSRRSGTSSRPASSPARSGIADLGYMGNVPNRLERLPSGVPGSSGAQSMMTRRDVGSPSPRPPRTGALAAARGAQKAVMGSRRDYVGEPQGRTDEGRRAASGLPGVHGHARRARDAYHDAQRRPVAASAAYASRRRVDARQGRQHRVDSRREDHAAWTRRHHLPRLQSAAHRQEHRRHAGHLLRHQVELAWHAQGAAGRANDHIFSS